MQEALIQATEIAVHIIDAMAHVIVLVGTIGAFGAALRLFFKRTNGHERRSVWLGYARWLVAGLTFQLAADIIESSITTSWDAIGRLAVIAVVRTFLNYFLERDLEDIRTRERERTEHATQA